MELQNQAILWSEPELVGWVEKRGDRSTTWNRRFFLLQGAYIFYYIKNNDIPNTEPVGVIPLEGGSIKDEDDSESGRRFCFLLRLSPELATFAKRANYHISAPSQEAKNAIALIMPPGELQVLRERASDLEVQLAISPKNLKEMQRHQGHESSVLQKEIQRVTEAYKKLKEEAIETCAEVDKVNTEAVQALGVWEIYTDYISGKNHKGSCHTMNRLNAEAALTHKLVKLLTAKRRLIGGEGIEHLSSQALEDLEAICKQGLRNILERQFQVRIKAPRYTSSIHPALLPEGCEDPVPRISHTLDMPERNNLEKRKRKSTSFQLLKESDIPEKQESLEGSKGFLQSYKTTSKSEGNRALEKSVVGVGLDKDYTVLEIEYEPQEIETELDDVAELVGREETYEAEVDSIIGEENSSIPLEQLAWKGLQKQVVQKSLEVWVNTTEQPSSSPSNLQKAMSQQLVSQQLVSQQPMLQQPMLQKSVSQKSVLQKLVLQKPVSQKALEAQMNTTKQPLKSPRILQKQMSFSQPNFLEADSSSQSTGSPQEHLTNDSKPSLGASGQRTPLEASNPTLTSPDHFQILTRPQWVQLRPQTFNIVGPTSIHTHDGGYCSTPRIDFYNMQGMQLQSSLVASKSKLNEEQSHVASRTNGHPLGEEKSLFDGSIKINLYKSGEEWCTPTTSNKDRFWPRKEENIPIGSIVNRHSLREEQGPQVRSRTDQRSLRKEQDFLARSKIDRQSLREEQGIPIQSIINRQSLREKEAIPIRSIINRQSLGEEDILIQSIIDLQSLEEEEDILIRSITNQQSLQEEDISIQSITNQQSLQEEEGIPIQSKTHQQPLKKEEGIHIRSRTNQQSLREEEGIHIRSKTNRQSLKEEGIPIRSLIDRHSLREELGLPIKSGTNWCSLREEDTHIQSRTGQHSLKEESGLPIGSKIDRRSLREEDIPILSMNNQQSQREDEGTSIRSTNNRQSLREEEDSLIQSINNRQSLREEDIPILSRKDRQSLKEKDGSPIQSTNNQQSLKEEDVSILLRKNRQSLKEKEGSFIQSMNNQQSLREEDIPILSRKDQQSFKEKEGSHIRSINNRQLPKEESGLSIESRTNRRLLGQEQSPPVASKIDRKRPPIVSKSGGYIESIIPSRLRALFQRMQPKPRNEYSPLSSPPQNNSMSPSAVIFLGTKRNTSPPRPPQSAHLSRPTMSKSRKQKNNQQHVKWTNSQVDTVLSPLPMKWTIPQANTILSPPLMKWTTLQADGVLSPPPIKWSTPQVDGVLSPPPIKWSTPRVDGVFSPPPTSEHVRSQSDMQHLLWSHPRVENISSPLLRTKKAFGHQSPKVRSPHHHMKRRQCASHRCLKPTYFHQHTNHAYEKCSSPHEFQRIPRTEHTKQNQTRQSQPQQCSHQCQHHHHKYLPYHYDQEEDCHSPSFHHNKTPKHNQNIATFKDCNDGWFSPTHPSEKCRNRQPSDGKDHILSYSNHSELEDGPSPKFHCHR